MVILIQTNIILVGFTYTLYSQQGKNLLKILFLKHLNNGFAYNCQKDINIMLYLYVYVTNSNKVY